MSVSDLLARLRELAGAVDRSPEDDAASAAVHHGVRILLLIGGAVLVPILFPRTPLPQFAHLEEGMVADEDVIAQLAFPVQKSPERLAEERREAEEGVAPIFVLDSTAVESAVERVERLFQAIDSAAAPGPEGRPDTTAIRRTLERFGISPTLEQVAHLLPTSQRETLAAAVQNAFRELLPSGVAPPSHVSEVSAGRVVVRGPGRDRMIRRDSILTTGRFYRKAVDGAPQSLGSPGLQLFQTLLVRFHEPSLQYDRSATTAAREQARAAVEPSAGHVLQGERIVAAHERVTRSALEKLRAYREELERRGLAAEEGGALRWGGAALYGFLLLAILGAVLATLRPRVYEDFQGFVLVLGLALFVLTGASLLTEVDHPGALVPVAFAAILVSVLYDGLLALVLVAVIAALVGGQPAFGGVTAPFLILVAGAAAALGVRGLRRRSESWILIAVVTGAYAAAGGALTMMRSLPLGDLLATAGWGGLNAAACTLFAVGAALPLLERITGITTDQTLLELSDLNRPLLRRLSREAPGTYVHSINVANLAEAACAAIGANALLARVGVYYHDIGKLSRPGFFIENQPRGRNPHDRIPPDRSAEVIRGHVTEGVRMAREEGLPSCIVDFIREHHGTTTIVYFLEKARRTADAAEPPLPEKYRYPGPRPRSRETAVVMLADGVESASRTLADPSPENVCELVEGIVEARRESGELDRCPLTLRDLDIVQREFCRVLAGMHHQRIDYPEGSGEVESSEGSRAPGTPEVAEEGPGGRKAQAGEEAVAGKEGRAGKEAAAREEPATGEVDPSGGSEAGATSPAGTVSRRPRREDERSPG